MGDLSEGREERRKLKCPRCGRVSWIDTDAGGIGARCPSCGGVHLSLLDVEQVVCHELQLSTADLRERAGASTDEHLGPCPACEGALSPVKLDDVDLELCLRCGAGWLDPGELERLTHGRHLERKPPDEVARQHLPAVVPGARRGRVSVPSRALVREVMGLVGISTGIAMLFFPIASVPLFVTGVLLLQRPRVVVDFDKRRLHAKGQGGFRLSKAVPLDGIRGVVVLTQGVVSATHSNVSWLIALRRGDEEKPIGLLSYRDRVIAHRVAFQLSQVLEVPVEAPEEADPA